MTRPAWSRLDHLQPLLAGMLVVLGLLTILSARADWMRQVLWVAVGIAAYSVVATFDYRRLRRLAPALYAGMLVLLVAVHLVGRTALGARRWLSVGGFPLEPSELSKLLLVLVLAGYLGRLERLSWRALAGAILLVAPPAYLILTQPDLGTTIVFIAVLMGMLFLAGARPWQLGSLIAVALVALPLLPYLLHGYQRRHRTHWVPDTTFSRPGSRSAPEGSSARVGFTACRGSSALSLSAPPISCSPSSPRSSACSAASSCWRYSGCC
jgi:cell division protein FtsW (lipid II flippase)